MLETAKYKTPAPYSDETNNRFFLPPYRLLRLCVVLLSLQILLKVGRADAYGCKSSNLVSETVVGCNTLFYLLMRMQSDLMPGVIPDKQNTLFL
ncbi:hypothetical protein SDC9_206449 [bioreactor metagenome]|uniref:Uncharacterized protein n=1 Tax=bioreactor metagenome TaxID=1076179 RepID=A0A645J5L1_9ZZZZ